MENGGRRNSFSNDRGSQVAAERELGGRRSISLQPRPTRVRKLEVEKRREYRKAREGYGGAVVRARLFCLFSFEIYVIATLTLIHP